MTTPSTENYLKAICELRRSLRSDVRGELRNDGGRVTTSALACHLNVAPASVTEMLQRLASEGLLDYQPYRGVALTEAGEREAIAVLQRHETIEQYLVGVFGFSPAQAHAEAERLEHVASVDLVRRMADVHRQAA